MPAHPLACGVHHYENFPVASWLCPPRLRPAIQAIYYFARTADDIADEGDASPRQRLDDLNQYHFDLLSCTQAGFVSTRWPAVFSALGPTITQFELPVPLLADLLSAFAQDVRQNHYATQAELNDYCRRSANPIGRLLLHLYGITDEAALAQSDCICTALQLINFWQDLSVDLARGRIYLPQDAMLWHHVTQSQLLALEHTPDTTNLIADNALYAWALMLKGSQLVKKIPGRAGWELRLVVQGGLRMLDQIDAAQGRTLLRRPKLRWWNAPLMLWRAVWM